MDFFAHTVAQCGVYQLVALDQALAGKGVGDDHCIEMLTVAFHLKVAAFKAGGDIVFYCFRCWVHDTTF